MIDKVGNKRDALEAFLHAFIAEPELERRFMGLVDEYTKEYHLYESKLLVEKMNNIELFDDKYSVYIDEESNSIKIDSK